MIGGAFWWTVRKVFGIERPSYYLGCLTNIEVDELPEPEEQESAAA
jgi:hypothetical protein